MSLKKLLIIILILFFIILILAAILMIFGQKPPQTGEDVITPPAIETPQAATQGETATPAINEFDDSAFNLTGDAVSPNTQEKERSVITFFTRSFLEDYGGFSSNSGYDHIKSLYPKMTAAFAKEVEQWIADDPARAKSPTFYSIETSVADVVIQTLEASRAVLKVDTKRIETDAPEYYNKSFKQEVEVMLVKEGGEWKVEKVEWK